MSFLFSSCCHQYKFDLSNDQISSGNLSSVSPMNFYEVRELVEELRAVTFIYGNWRLIWALHSGLLAGAIN